MTLRERAVTVARLFEIEYPDVKCGLEAGDNAYRLLMMAILSAQCTDKRVNIISVPLFEKYHDIHALAECSLDELERIVRPGIHNALYPKNRRMMRHLKSVWEDTQTSLHSNKPLLCAFLL